VINFSGSNHVPVNPPASPKVSDRASALERNLLPRQLNDSRRSAANRRTATATAGQQAAGKGLRRRRSGGDQSGDMIRIAITQAAYDRTPIIDRARARRPPVRSTPAPLCHRPAGSARGAGF